MGPGSLTSWGPAHGPSAHETPWDPMGSPPGIPWGSPTWDPMGPPWDPRDPMEPQGRFRNKTKISKFTGPRAPPWDEKKEFPRKMGRFFVV